MDFSTFSMMNNPYFNTQMPSSPIFGETKFNDILDANDFYNPYLQNHSLTYKQFVDEKIPHEYMYMYMNNISHEPLPLNYRQEWDDVIGISDPVKKVGRPLEYEKKFNREPTEYNLFIRDEITRMKNLDADVSSKDIFRDAVTAWRTHKK